MAVRFHASHPEFLAGLRIKGAEAFIICTGNENQPTGCSNGTAEIGDTGFGDPFCFQVVHDAERNLPGNFSDVQIHGVQHSPGRLLTRIMIFVPKARIGSPLASPHIRFGRTRRLWFHLAYRTQFVDVHEQISEGGIK